jgi:TonB-dependent SusC/RagA subfamily outer membrane receptor
MTSFSMRALLSVSFLIGLGSGCSHRNKPATAASPSPATSAPNSTVTSEDIAKAPGQSIEQVLMGRFPGVEVSRTADGGFAVRIRGGSSIRGSNTPLYVLDGVVIDPGPNGYLTGVNPNDIETIEVLKEPAETALYGLRGANGVILITTKRPGQ